MIVGWAFERSVSADIPYLDVGIYAGLSPSFYSAGITDLSQPLPEASSMHLHLACAQF